MKDIKINRISSVKNCWIIKRSQQINAVPTKIHMTFTTKIDK